MPLMTYFHHQTHANPEFFVWIDIHSDRQTQYPADTTICYHL